MDFLARRARGFKTWRDARNSLSASSSATVSAVSSTVSSTSSSDCNQKTTSPSRVSRSGKRALGAERVLMLSAVFSVMLALVFSLQGVLNQGAVTSVASGNVSGKLVAGANVSGFESVAKGVRGLLTGSIIMFVDDGSGAETPVVIPPGETRTIKGSIRRVQMPDGSVINYETDASPVLNAVKVRSDIQESYNVMLRQVNKTVAKEVLGVKPDAVYTVPIADVGNGGKNVPILHEFFVLDYRLVDYPAGERRVNFNVGADTLDAPCGGKGQICCEGACFADDITYGAVKDENTRCYGLTDTNAGICECGAETQRACTRGADPAQPYPCSEVFNAENPNTNKCEKCGSWNQIQCDTQRLQAEIAAGNTAVSGRLANGGCVDCAISDNGGCRASTIGDEDTVCAVGTDDRCGCACLIPAPSETPEGGVGVGGTRIGCEPLGEQGQTAEVISGPEGTLKEVPLYCNSGQPPKDGKCCQAIGHTSKYEELCCSGQAKSEVCCLGSGESIGKYDASNCCNGEQMLCSKQTTRNCNSDSNCFELVDCPAEGYCPGNPLKLCSSYQRNICPVSYGTCSIGSGVCK